MISERDFVIFLPSSSLRIYWQYYSGSRRDPPLPMTTMQSPGGRKLNDDTSSMQEWHMANAIDPPPQGSEVGQQTPASGHVHDYHIERGCGWWWWWWWWRTTAKWVQRTISFYVLVEEWLHACLPWPCKNVRVQIHTPVALPLGKEAPVPTEKDGWAPVRGPDASRSGKFTDPAGNRGSEQRQHI